jgi:hypothetical protein
VSTPPTSKHTLGQRAFLRQRGRHAHHPYLSRSVVKSGLHLPLKDVDLIRKLTSDPLGEDPKWREGDSDTRASFCQRPPHVAVASTACGRTLTPGYRIRTEYIVKKVTPGRMRSRASRAEILKNSIFSDLTRRLADFGLEITLEWQKRTTTNLFSDSTQALSFGKDSSQKGSS